MSKRNRSMDSPLEGDFWGFDGGFLSQLPGSNPVTQSPLDTIPNKTQPENAETHSDIVSTYSKLSQNFTKLESIGPVHYQNINKTDQIKSFTSAGQETSFSASLGRNREQPPSKDAKTVDLTAQIQGMNISN